jgi:hypothetical protein
MMSIITTGKGSPYSPENLDYVSAAFINLIDSHKQYLQNHRETTVIQISPKEAIKYQGDFYGLLIHKKIDPKLWYPCLRITGIIAPTENDITLRVILVPSPTEIDALMARLKIRT